MQDPKTPAAPLPGIPQSSAAKGGPASRYSVQYEVHEFTNPARSEGARRFSTKIKSEAIAYFERHEAGWEFGGFAQKVERSLLKFSEARTMGNA